MLPRMYEEAFRQPGGAPPEIPHDGIKTGPTDGPRAVSASQQG